MLLTLVFACSALTHAQSLLQTRDLSATQIDSYSDDEMRALQQKIVEMVFRKPNYINWQKKEDWQQGRLLSLGKEWKPWL